jgi:hypothetical protein
LTFSSLLTGAGVNIEADAIGSFTATLQLFNSDGTLVDSFSEAGLSDFNADGSAIFIGLANESPFTSVQFSVSHCPCDNADFAINSVSFTPVPEPANGVWPLFPLFGLMLLTYRGRRSA